VEVQSWIGLAFAQRLAIDLLSLGQPAGLVQQAPKIDARRDMTQIELPAAFVSGKGFLDVALFFGEPTLEPGLGIDPGRLRLGHPSIARGLGTPLDFDDLQRITRYVDIELEQ